MIITDDLRDLIGRYMADRGLNQKAFGQLVGCSGPTVSRWLTGEVDHVNQQHSQRLMALLRIEQDVLERPIFSASGEEARDTIRNTPALRQFMMREILARGYDLKSVARLAGYDNVDTLKRLIDGELDWYPAMLSGVLGALGTDFEDAPLSAAERALLHPAYGDGWQTRDVPVLSMAHAAECAVVNGAVEIPSFWEGERYPAPTDGRQYVAFRVEGDSMAPRIRGGDIVLCDVKADVVNGNVVVAKFNDNVVCKRFRRVGDTVLLTSDNQAAGQDFEVVADDLAWLLRAARTISDL